MALTIEPARVDHLDALIAGDVVFEERFGLRVAERYLDFPEALEPSRQALIEGVPAEWMGHLFVAEKTLVGFGGYKGPPRNGEVEIGYSIAPAHRERGHATAAVQELVMRAAAERVGRVTAHTLPGENASTRVLGRCQFEMTGAVSHPERGRIWRWERPA